MTENILLYKTENGILQLITVLIIFVFVLAVTYYTTRWIAGFQKTRAVGTNIESVEVFRITNNKYIQILRTGKEYIVIAVCKDSITLLNKINEEDLDFTRKAAVSKESFGQILDRIKNIKQKGK